MIRHGRKLSNFFHKICDKHVSMSYGDAFVYFSHCNKFKNHVMPLRHYTGAWVTPSFGMFLTAIGLVPGRIFRFIIRCLTSRSEY